jgi:multicomponent Na+:H+ antiporter subunit C
VTIVTALAIAVLFGSGVHLMVKHDALKLAAGTLLVSNAAILFLMSATFDAREAALLPVDNEQAVADPLVQALALTAVIIGFGITVLLLRLALAVERTHDTIGTDDLVQAEVADDEIESGSAEDRR